MLPLNTSLIVEAEQSERHDEVLCSEIEEELFELRYRQKGHFSSSIQLYRFKAFVCDKTDFKCGESPNKSVGFIANDLPLEVLLKIAAFTQLGRVSKAWSHAMTIYSRRRFQDCLSKIMRPLTDNFDRIVMEVENQLFELYKECCTLPKAYGQKARQLLFNLRDSRNDFLRDRLLSGELSASALVRMSANEMANPQLVKQRKQWMKKRTYEVMRNAPDLEGLTESDMFECRSCGCSRTRYRQWRRKAIVDRTRIIIICTQCPYRWEL
ncbi:unnamed protein product [Albugo candida]|uniref:TFIIS central domain-containing protein n=1 Tax=Albugo candida TaxID=65357 RepID=A0A024GVT2_9STRA|nr:unnamed protein product [Albugo candida]|eukprot:CCI50819.1 unnamed protein product [Albugo candida]